MNILITGATGKIGSQIAKVLGQNHNLILHYNSNIEKAQELKSNLKKYNTKTELIKYDLYNNKNTFIGKCNNIFVCDGIINCCSIYNKNDINILEEEVLLKDITINAMCPLFLIKAFAKTPYSKFFINFLDSKGLSYDNEHISYSYSEMLLEKVIKKSALEFAPLRINGIALGLNESDSETLPSKLPLKEKVTYNDIIKTINYLINSPHITGEIIHLDSGRHIRN